MTVDWRDILLTVSAPHHAVYGAMGLTILAVYTALAYLNGRQSVTVFRNGLVLCCCLNAAVYALIGAQAWQVVMVEQRASVAFTVHCIWFNGLLSASYLLLTALQLKDSVVKRLTR